MNPSAFADSRFHAQPMCQVRSAQLASADRTSSIAHPLATNATGAPALVLPERRKSVRPLGLLVDAGAATSPLTEIVTGLPSEASQHDANESFALAPSQSAGAYWPLEEDAATPIETFATRCPHLLPSLMRFILGLRSYAELLCKSSQDSPDGAFLTHPHPGSA